MSKWPLTEVGLPSACMYVLVAQLCPAVHGQTPWTVAHQRPLSMEFPRQEYWNG